MALKTIRVEVFLILSNFDSNISIHYSCIMHFKHLCISETIHVDGTFYYCVQLLYQLFTFHDYSNGHYTPLVFCFLRDKKQGTYILIVLDQFVKKCL